MEQIVVYNRAGKVKTKLYATSKLCAVKSAEQKRVLLGEDTLQIQTESVEPLDLQIGDYCIMYGSQYTLNAMPEPTKEGEHQYKTDLTFEGIQYKLLDVQYRNKDVLGNNTSGSFTLMADLALAMQVLINCLNSHAKAEGSGEVWMLGDCPNTEYKELTFSNENCLAVLQRLCGEDLFNIEFEIEPLGNKQYKLHLRKAGSVFPAAFTFGKGGGVYELKRKNVDSKNVVTRLYVEGGTRNITTKYRNGAQRLRLDGESYIQQEKPVAAMGIKEGAKQYDDIYPHRKGTVTAAGASIFEFVDSSMFDLNKKDSEGNTEYLQDNTPAKVKFLTGGCAGYELEITKYDHATKTFKVKAYEDSRGWKIPSQDSEAYRIAKGDTYVLLDIIMPHDPYVTDAEKELLEQGTKYYEKNSQPRVEYELTIKSLYLKRKFGADGTVVNLFNVGDYITIRDAEIGVDKAIRIKEFTRNASTDPYDYKVTLSDVVEVSIIERLISDQIETDKIIEINNLTDLAKARANWRTTQELLNMVFDGEGYFDPTHIKPSSIETMMLSVGSRASQFVLQNIVITANSISGNKPNPNLITIQSNGGVLIHYAIEDKDRSWSIQGGSVTLTTDGAYYVYARCAKAGSTGSIIISQSKINVDDGNSAGYYHFVIGVISSIFNGYREVTLTYGATRITGRTINCGRIESIDKKTYFDLDNGEIGGKIRFTSGNGTDRLVSELEGDVNGHTQDLNALTSAVGSQGETLNGLTESVGEQGDNINTLNNTTELLKQEVSKNGTSLGELNALVNGQGETLQGVQDTLNSLKDQVDGTVEYWYGEVVPTDSNYPASEWAHDKKDEHLGDIYTDTKTGTEYRYSIKYDAGMRNPTYYWQEIASSGIGTAIKTANEALAAAGFKSHVYVTASVKSTPPATYKVGDLWLMLDTCKMKYCVKDSDGVSYRATDWKDAGYTDDTTANKALDELKNLADDSVITPAEKLELKTKWQELKADYGVLQTELANAGISQPALLTAYTSLNTYVSNLLKDMDKNSSVSRDEYNTKFQVYYTERANARKKLTETKTQVFITANASTKPADKYKKGDLWLMLDTYKIKICIKDSAGSYKASDWGDAGYTDDTQALKALSQLSDLAADNKVTPAEKLMLKGELNNIRADFTQTASKATTAGVITTKYEEVFNALVKYANNLLANMNSTSTVNRDAYNKFFADYYTERANIIDAIAQKKVDDVEIGQGNYIANGAFFESTKGWSWAGVDTNLTAKMKETTKSDLNRVKADYTNLTSLAKNKSVPIPTAYTNSYIILMAYVGNLLSDASSTTKVDTVYYNKVFTDYESNRDSLATTLRNKGLQPFMFLSATRLAGDCELYMNSTMGNVLRMSKSNTSSLSFLITRFAKFNGNIMLPNNKFRAGLKYTLAFWVRANKDLELNVGFMESAGQKPVAKYVPFHAGTSWKRIVYTFTANEQQVEDIALHIRGEQTTTYEWLMFTKFVLVEGNKAPEWTGSSQEFLAQVQANKDTLKAITDNYTEINGGLILSTFLKLGAILKNGNWTESAGLKAMLDNANEIAAYFGGTYAEALAGKKEDMTVIYHNGKFKALDAEIKGKIIATSGEFTGTLNGVEGTFKVLKAVDKNGNTKASIYFSASDSCLTFEGDMQHQGNLDGRSLRFLSSDIWCRGVFGHHAKTVAVVKGGYMNVYPKGVDNSSVYVSLKSAKTSDGTTFYYIPLYGNGQSAGWAGMPIDVVVLNVTRKYYYAFTGMETGKEWRVINGNDKFSEVYFCDIGGWHNLVGGESLSCVYVNPKFLNPVPASTSIGRGIFWSGEKDLNW